MTKQRFPWLVAGALSGLFVAACTTVPETGRKQLNFIPDSVLVPAAYSQFQSMRQEVGVSSNTSYNEQVNRIGREIVLVARAQSPDADLPPVDQWQFTVFTSPQVNAFAMPGGFVGFYEGILDLFENEDQLAAVMAHEVAHVVAKHGNERASQALGLQLGMLGATIGLGYSDMSPQSQQALIAAIGLGSQVGILLPFSRHHESEADYLGLVYMTRAGYDPHQAVRFWEIMQQQSSGQPPEWLSTHPASTTRIRQMRADIPHVLAQHGRN
jgi:predicted Zn-dependent protease